MTLSATDRRPIGRGGTTRLLWGWGVQLASHLILFAFSTLFACVGLALWRFDGGFVESDRVAGFCLFLFGSCFLALLAVAAAIDAWRGQTAAPPPDRGEPSADADWAYRE